MNTSFPKVLKVGLSKLVLNVAKIGESRARLWGMLRKILTDKVSTFVGMSFCIMTIDVVINLNINITF